MATLAEVVAVLSGTHDEVYEQVQARTVSTLGKIWGADVQKVMASAGLLGLIQDTVNATGTYSGFRDMCIAMKDRFGAGGEIDFTDQYTLDFMDAFLADPQVTGIIMAGPTYVTVQNFKAAVLAQATIEQPEFPGVTLRDVIAIREPALAQETETPYRRIYGLSDVYTLTLADDLPEVCDLTAEISHDLQAWRPVPVVGLDNIKEQGNYSIMLSLSPMPPINASSYIRVKCPYNVALGLE